LASSGAPIIFFTVKSAALERKLKGGSSGFARKVPGVRDFLQRAGPDLEKFGVGEPCVRDRTSHSKKQIDLCAGNLCHNDQISNTSLRNRLVS